MRVTVVLEIEIEAEEASREELMNFVEYYVCQNGGISLKHPLYEADHDIELIDVKAID